MPKRPKHQTQTVALRKESVDRNFDAMQIVIVIVQSLSARRAWIEIIDYIIDYATDAVALRKESVDRNLNRRFRAIQHPKVALRKESVDRNAENPMVRVDEIVALRKESVDRNCHNLNLPSSPIESLSARRAWIEISGINCKTSETAVALRKESVDRN